MASSNAKEGNRRRGSTKGFQAANREGNMCRVNTLVLALSLCLICKTVRADTIACDAPDLGLANTSAKEQVDAMLKQATACVREKSPGGQWRY